MFMGREGKEITISVIILNIICNGSIPNIRIIIEIIFYRNFMTDLP
jgi:hypothetical protein